MSHAHGARGFPHLYDASNRKGDAPQLANEMRGEQASSNTLGRHHHAKLTAGFTLIEVMVVIVIVTLLSAIAVPTVSRRLDANLARGVTESVAIMFRNARLNALGRGAATAIRFDAGQITIVEAVQGTTCGVIPGCATLPVNSCTNALNRFMAGGGPTLINQQLATFDATRQGSLATSMGYQLGGGLLSTTSAVDICFTPMGRTFVRAGATSAALDAVAFTPLTSSAQVRVVEYAGVGAARFAVLAPNGAARAVHQ
jgi:prepilin-type N-terminal cleavage/methylation domain-containing protein